MEKKDDIPPKRIQLPSKEKKQGPRFKVFDSQEHEKFYKTQDQSWEEEALKVDEERKPHSLLLITFFLCLGVILSAAFFFFFVPKEQEEKEVLSVVEEKKLEKKQEQLNEKIIKPKYSISLAKQKECADFLRAYFEAKDAEARLEYILRPKIAAPHVEKETIQFPSFEQARKGVIETISKNGVEYYRFPVKWESAKGVNAFVFFLKETPTGLKLNWQSLVGYNSLDMGLFSQLRPSVSSIMRVYISEVSYYNYEFQDEGEYRSFRLVDSQLRTPLFGYVKRGGKIEEQITLVLFWLKISEGITQAPMTLKLRFLPGRNRQSNTVEIVELVSPNWL